ncbi:MAG TPA: fatty acid desaturase [Myxococcaceae bacterium]|jgi:fatty acid desaturase
MARADLKNFSKRDALHSPTLSYLTLMYGFGGFGAGLACVLSADWRWWPLGVLLLAHTVAWCGLLSHDAMHNAIFRSRRMNHLSGAWLTWISGACYFPFELLRDQHLEHHRYHVGVDGFSVTRWLKQQSRLVRALVIAAEWAYIPVLTVLINIRSRALPLYDPANHYLRGRVLRVFCVRVSALVLMAWIQPWAPLLYLASHFVMIHFMRLYDCFHHTFDVYPRGAKPTFPDEYLQENTYSSLFSRKRAWLNWVFLNYGYHNAHHEKPHVPWHALPALDAAMFGESEAHCLVGRNLFWTYHHHRLNRIHTDLGRPRVENGRLNTQEYWGIIMNITFLSYSP